MAVASQCRFACMVWNTHTGGFCLGEVALLAQAPLSGGDSVFVRISCKSLRNGRRVRALDWVAGEVRVASLDGVENHVSADRGRDWLSGVAAMVRDRVGGAVRRAQVEKAE